MNDIQRARLKRITHEELDTAYAGGWTEVATYSPKDGAQDLLNFSSPVSEFAEARKLSEDSLLSALAELIAGWQKIKR